MDYCLDFCVCPHKVISLWRHPAVYLTRQASLANQCGAHFAAGSEVVLGFDAQIELALAVLDLEQYQGVLEQRGYDSKLWDRATCMLMAPDGVSGAGLISDLQQAVQAYSVGHTCAQASLTELVANFLFDRLETYVTPLVPSSNLLQNVRKARAWLHKNMLSPVTLPQLCDKPVLGASTLSWLTVSLSFTKHSTFAPDRC